MNILNLAQKIVSIPSYLDKENNINEITLGNFIFEYFKSNIKTLQVVKQKEKDGERFNIIASNTTSPTLVFSCHMDTVQPVLSVEKQMDVRVEGDKLFGLGASDMKGGLAAIISAVEDLQANLPPIAIVFDYDEEYYFAGIIDFLREYKYRPDLAVFTEPTNLQILNGCRGITEVRFDVIGRSGHGSRPEEAVNAIEAAYELIKKLKISLSKKNTKQIGMNSINFSSLQGGREQDGRIIEQANAVPDIARVLLDIRISNSDVNAKFILKKLQELAKPLSVKIRQFTCNLEIQPVFTPKEKLQLVELSMSKVMGKFSYNKELDKTGLFEGAYVKPEWDCPCIAFGPGPRNTEFTIGEYVSISDLKIAKDIYKEIINSI